MSESSLDELAHTIRRLIGWVRHIQEQTAARVSAMNETIESLARSPGLPPLVVLGDPIIEADAATCQGEPPKAVLQPAFLVPQGLGAVRWELSALANLESQGETLETAAPRGFVPFALCEPGLQCALLPQLVGLLARVYEELGGKRGLDR